MMDKGDEMGALARLAGFFAAHGVWSVSGGEVLVPMVAFEMRDGRRAMNRLVAERLEDSVENGKKMLAQSDGNALRGVLVYDGYITLPAGKTDALFIEARSYENACTLQMAVPYRNVASPRGFAVYRPKFQHADPAPADFNAVGEAFFAGVDGHEQAAAVWNAHIDQSQ